MISPFYPNILMMEQAHARERHDHIVFIARLDHEIVADGTARLGYIGNAALFSALDIVGEREKCVAAQRHARDLGQIRFLLFFRKRFRTDGKILFPYAVAQNVFTLVGKINVDDIVFIGPTDPLCKLQIQYFIALAQMPKIRFVARKPCAVYAGLLPRTYADRLPVRRKTDGIGLRIFKRNEGKMRSVFAESGRFMFFVTIFFRRSASILNSFLPCSNVMPNTCLCSTGSGL